jgi:type IV pilus assembly protein PilM
VSEYALTAASSRTPNQQAKQLLPERGLTASPSAPNILKPQLYREALAKAAGANGKRQTSALVIPDYAARMAVLDFENFPAGEPERLALIRFRLRKTVPFPIDEAQVSYSIQLSQNNLLEVLAVAIARPILEEYEAIFTDAGYRVGMVIPSVLASLPLCDKAVKGLTLLAKATGYTLSAVLIEEGRMRLIRCLDLGITEQATAQEGAAAIMPLLQQTLAFSEDQLGEKVSQVLLCGFREEANTIRAAIGRDFGVPCTVITAKFGSTVPEAVGLLGMLEKYAA